MGAAPITDLQGKVAAVTGAASGIGLAIAERYAGLGAVVVGLDQNERRRGDFEAVVAAPGRFVRLDVSDAEAVDRTLRDIADEHGRLDVVVTSAGIRDIGDPLTLPPEEWRRVIDVDLSGTFYCSQAAARVMVDQRAGSIVNIASVAGFLGFRSRAAYTVAKHGVLGVTRVLAAAVGHAGVRVNAICPGMVETPLTEGYVRAPEVLDSFKIVVPAGRAATPGEIADVAAFLAADGSRFVNGVVLPVDGGFSATNTYDLTSGEHFTGRFSVIEEGL